MDIEQIVALIQETADNDTWVPDEEFSVFNQYDRSYYCENREAFTHKYRVFKAIANVLQPDHIVELGAHGGSGADAYLTGVNYQARYTGYDSFGPAQDEDGGLWVPDEICQKIFKSRDYNRYNLITCDLRNIERIAAGDLVVVDAGHDYRNAYQDLILALKSQPEFIHIDDYCGTDGVSLAVDDFAKNWAENIDGFGFIQHVSGSALIKMKYDDV